jgi:hypothetical protein
MKTYEVVATRSGRWWALEVTGLRLGFSQARRLTDIEPVARELIAGLTEVPEDSFAVTVRVERPDEDGPFEPTSVEVLAELRRHAVLTELALGKVLDHLGLSAPTDDEIDAALDRSIGDQAPSTTKPPPR